jgi:hypothetical protein
MTVRPEQRALNRKSQSRLSIRHPRSVNGAVGCETTEAGDYFIYATPDIGVEKVVYAFDDTRMFRAHTSAPWPIKPLFYHGKGSRVDVLLPLWRPFLISVMKRLWHPFVPKKDVTM